MSPENYQKIIEACWKLANGGLSALDAEHISQEVQLSVQEITILFPEKKHVIFALLADLKSKVVLPEAVIDSEGSPAGNLSADDLFFDAIFAYFDGATPYKTAIKKLSQELLWDPLLMIAITPTFQDFANDLIMRYYPSPEGSQSIFGLGQRLAQKLGYQLLLLRVFYVWVEDDSFDSGKTMAALDQGMKQIKDCQSFLGI